MASHLMSQVDLDYAGRGCPIGMAHSIMRLQAELRREMRDMDQNLR